ncbi:hypothetical protein GCM10009801_13470 [Streptomyces albiaxialis]|uniref:Multi-component regulatory system-3 n=1 Tax=Streptomyces albiaxialis TaxID=329523 RepID=A0ABN2VNL9_9ACTN
MGRHLIHAPSRTEGAPSRAADATGGALDLAALVSVMSGTEGLEPGAGPWVGPRHTTLLDACRGAPLPLAELAVITGLSVTAVRALIGDLLRRGCVTVDPPGPPTGRDGACALSEVVDALRAL